MLPPESEEDYQPLLLASEWENCEIQYFVLKGISWHILDYWIPKNSTDMAGPPDPPIEDMYLIFVVLATLQIIQCYQYVDQCDNV